MSNCVFAVNTNPLTLVSVDATACFPSMWDSPFGRGNNTLAKKLSEHGKWWLNASRLSAFSSLDRSLFIIIITTTTTIILNIVIPGYFATPTASSQ